MNEQNKRNARVWLFHSKELALFVELANYC